MIGLVPVGSQNNAVLYVIYTHFYCFHYADTIHSQLLVAISSALLFLGMSYTPSYSGSPVPNTESHQQLFVEIQYLQRWLVDLPCNGAYYGVRCGAHLHHCRMITQIAIFL